MKRILNSTVHRMHNLGKTGMDLSLAPQPALCVRSWEVRDARRVRIPVQAVVIIVLLAKVTVSAQLLVNATITI